MERVASPTGLSERPIDDALWDRLVARAHRNSSTGCLEWSRSCTSRRVGTTLYAYGRVWTGKRVELAHRAAWRAWHGPIREGMCVCHHCDNPKCIEPTHLFVGSHFANMRDCADKGRTRPQKGPMRVLRGRERWSAKVSERDVLEIVRLRNEGGLTYEQLAEKYGIDRMQISLICRGLAWQHVTRPVFTPVRRIKTRYSAETIEQVRAMRASGAKLREVAEKFGMTTGYVSHICQGRYRSGHWGYAPSKVDSSLGNKTQCGT